MVATLPHADYDGQTVKQTTALAWIKGQHYHAWRLIVQYGQLGDKSGKSEVAHRQSPAVMVTIVDTDRFAG